MIAITKPLGEGTSGRPCGTGPCDRDCGRTNCEYAPKVIAYRIDKSEPLQVQILGKKPNWTQFDKRRWAR